MLNHTKLRLATFAIAAGLLAPMAMADTPNNANLNDRKPAVNTAGEQAKPPVMDKDFVDKAANGGMAEVKLGEFAAKNGSAPEVKQFGQMMVDDHSKANDELKTLAQQKKWTVPTEIKGDEKDTYDRLSKLNGADFDRQYVMAMLKDHREDIADFENQASTGQDADLKTWATKTLPTLRAHLKMAQDTAKKIGVDEGAITAGEKQPPADKGQTK